jgi:hypothetical protein
MTHVRRLSARQQRRRYVAGVSVVVVAGAGDFLGRPRFDEPAVMREMSLVFPRDRRILDRAHPRAELG